MEKLDNVHKRELRREDLERFPVWVWDDEQEGHHPLTGPGTIPAEFPTAFMRANFSLPSGHELAGYLVGLDSFYAFGLFVDGEHYVVNRNARDLAGPVFELIAQKLGVREVMPMRYRCDVFEGQPPIEGILDF
jgi:hypothetical protein